MKFVSTISAALAAAIVYNADIVFGARFGVKGGTFDYNGYNPSNGLDVFGFNENGEAVSPSTLPQDEHPLLKNNVLDADSNNITPADDEEEDSDSENSDGVADEEHNNDIEENHGNDAEEEDNVDNVDDKENESKEEKELKKAKKHVTHTPKLRKHHKRSRHGHRKVHHHMRVNKVDAVAQPSVEATETLGFSATEEMSDDSTVGYEAASTELFGSGAAETPDETVVLVV